MYKVTFVIVAVIISAETGLALPGSGTEADPWRIESLADFNEFAADPNYWDDYTRLETDVNLAGLTYNTSVIASTGSFAGVFDGNGCKVIGFTIAGGGSYMALFGRIYGGEVKNLGIEGGSVSGTGLYIGSLVGDNRGTVSNCYSTGDVSGGSEVGGLVGHNYGGSVSNCCSTGDVSGYGSVGGLVGCNIHASSVSNCYSTGFVSGDGAVGGLVGQNGNDGTISNCYSTSSVRGGNDAGGLVGGNFVDGNVSNSYSTGDVSGDFDVGGLAGSSSGNVSNCYSTGDVSGRRDYVGGLLGGNGNKGSVWNCYSIGDVNGLGDYVGGLVGKNFEIVSNCFWDTDTQTHSVTDSFGDNDGTVINVEGLPTAQMQTKSTFTSAGWDFVDIWDLTCEGMNYPRFIWQKTAVDYLCPHGVDFRDYSFFANRWMYTNCGGTNDCDGADLDFSDKVDWVDLKIFCNHWLEGANR